MASRNTASNFLVLWVSLALAEVVLGQSLDHPRAAGVVLYKDQGFLPDDRAVAYEVSRVNNRAGVARFTTLRGTTVTVHPKSDWYYVPYPGKDPDVDVQGALLLVAHAKKKYPQYASMWRNLEVAWRNYEKTPDTAQEARRAKAQENQSLWERATGWLQGRQFTAQQEGGAAGASRRSGDSPRLSSPLAPDLSLRGSVASPTPTPLASQGEAEKEPSGKWRPEGFDEVERYYRTVEEMQNQ